MDGATRWNRLSRKGWRKCSCEGIIYKNFCIQSSRYCEPGEIMHCPMLNKKCQKSFCMAFTHRKIRDANGCHEMHGYCRHYKVIMNGVR